MATFQFEGLNEYAEKLRKLSDKAEGMIKRAVWEGAHVMANQIAAEIAKLPEHEDEYVPEAFQPVIGVTAKEKAGLIAGLGVAKMQNSGGFINTKIGFKGYNGDISKKYPNGHPNAMIARAVESGSSFRRKNPFVRRTIYAFKDDAEAAMAARFDADTKKEIN